MFTQTTLPLSAEVAALRTARTLLVKENDYLFKAGETPKAIYLVKSGCVKIVTQRKQARGRTTSSGFITKIAGPGDLIGLKEIIKNVQYEAFAKALRPTEVEVIDKGSVEATMSGPVSSTQMALSQLVRDLEDCDERAQFHYLASVQERIWNQLQILGQKFGVSAHDGIHLNLRLTRSELAQLAGTINESLSRHLTEFKSQGLIDLNGKEIILKTSVPS